MPSTNSSIVHKGAGDSGKPMTLDKEIIMVVEDDQVMREALVDILQLTGAQETDIRSFANGAEALEFLQEEAPSGTIVLCDIAMPHLNGLGLYKKVRAERSGLKFVFITAYELMRSERRFLERERLDVLKKPFTRAELVAAILGASGRR